MKENRRDYIVCDICHGPIFKADDEHCGDDIYRLNDLNICEDCIYDYLRDVREEAR